MNEFLERLRELVRATLPKLEAEFGKLIPLVKSQRLQFSGSSAKWEPKSEVDHWSVQTSTERILREIPEMDRLLTAAQIDPQVRDALLVDAGGNPVLADQQKHWLINFRLASHFFGRYFDRVRSFSWDERTFDELIDDLRAYVEWAEISVIVTAPLNGFSSSMERLDFDEDLWLERLSDEEKSSRVPAPSSGLGVGADQLQNLLLWKYALRVRTRNPRNQGLLLSAADQRLSEALTVLRLHSPGRISAFAVWTDSERPTFEFVGGSRTFPGYAFGQYHLSSDSAAQLLALYAQYRNYRANAARKALSVFDLAIRRFNAANERLNVEDRIVDLWVALEALFLPDGKTGELKYKASVRIARFIGENQQERIQIRNRLDRSYRIRSKVVHGDEVDSAELQSATNETEEYVRRALDAWTDPARPHSVDSLDNQLLG